MGTEDIKNFIAKNELNIQETKASLIAANLVYFEGFSKMREFYPVGFEKIIIFHKGDYLWQYLSQDKLNDIIANLQEEFLDNRNNFNRRVFLFKKITEELKNCCASINIEKLKEEKLDIIWQEYNRFCDVFVKFWKITAIGEEKGIYAERYIIPELADKYNWEMEKAKEYFFTLVHPETTSIFTQERIDFYNLCLTKDKEQLELLKKFRCKYFWKKTDLYQASEYTLEDVKIEVDEQLNKHGEATTRGALRKIKEDATIAAESKNKLKTEIAFDGRTTSLIEFVKTLGEMADERKESMMIGFYYFHSFIRTIANKTNTEYDNVIHLISNDELLALVKEGKINKEIIKERNNGIVLIFDDQEKTPSIFYGEYLEELKQFIDEKEKQTELKGTVASKGNQVEVTGVVKIVLDPKKEEFIEGSILVTSMTRPEFVPLMKKAKAIVTNEGGITCHAAIVSRELGIPCIIGTKIATSFLKNGQKIRLDLTSGIINLN